MSLMITRTRIIKSGAGEYIASARNTRYGIHRKVGKLDTVRKARLEAIRAHSSQSRSGMTLESSAPPPSPIIQITLWAPYSSQAKLAGFLNAALSAAFTAAGRADTYGAASKNPGDGSRACATRPIRACRNQSIRACPNRSIRACSK